MRILGVDPGLTRCGYAVVDIGTDRRVTLLAAAVVSSRQTDALGVRLMHLEAELEHITQVFQPTRIAIERVFSQKNVRTMAGTAQASGIAALIGARYAIPVDFHTPTEVKAAVTGSGAAQKAQVAHMVARIVGEPVPGPADLTDAVAIAICHGWRSQIPNHVSTALRGQQVQS